MYTDPSCQSMPWGSSKHPPPLKPLPPLPRVTHLTLPEPGSNNSLLSHPVPSPSLRLDMMTLHNENTSCMSSTRSLMHSSTLRRDSASSIIEFAQSLLPPTPYSSHPLTPANSVECRLQQTPDREMVSSPGSLVAKRGATPDQLHKLCSELEYLHIERRDSAMFDTTKPGASNLHRTRTEKSSRYASNFTSRTNYTSDLVSGISGDSAETKRQSRCQSHSPRHQSCQPAETSFIDWDDEIPRLAKVKKSIADLRGVTRARSSSAHIASTQASFVSNGSSSPTLVQSTIVATDTDETTQVCDKRLSASRPISPVKFCKRKHIRHRKTVLVADSTKRFSQHNSQRKGSAGTITSSYPVKRKRTSIASSRQSHHRFSGFNKLTTWMKRAVNCV